MFGDTIGDKLPGVRGGHMEILKICFP